MSKNYTSSHKIQTTTSSSSSAVSSSSTSFKYNALGRTSNISSSVNKLNNDYKPKSNMVVNSVNVRPAITKTTTKTTTTTNYTPVYQTRERSYTAPTTTYTSINRLPSSQTAYPKNYSIFNEVASSMPKQTTKLQPNKSKGLFYSYDDNHPTPKQSIVIPAMVTAAAFNTQPTIKPVDRPIPPPSLLVDRPIKKNFITKMISSKRGYAVIFNHYKYQNGYQSTREGTQFDVDKLKLVFDDFNISTQVKTDLRLSEIQREVNYLSNKDFTKYECFIIVIMTHGKRNEILCANDTTYNFIDEIEDRLLNENKTLLDKPKIFMIQACRGSDEMPVIQTDSVQITMTRRQSSVIKRNIFKCNATYEGYVSFRNTKNGTIFIQALCKKLKEVGRTETIYNIMMKVIDEVSNDPEIPQVPTVVSSMTNSFCFGSLLR